MSHFAEPARKELERPKKVDEALAKIKDYEQRLVLAEHIELIEVILYRERRTLRWAIKHLQRLVREKEKA